MFVLKVFLVERSSIFFTRKNLFMDMDLCYLDGRGKATPSYVSIEFSFISLIFYIDSLYIVMLNLVIIVEFSRCAYQLDWV